MTPAAASDCSHNRRLPTLPWADLAQDATGLAAAVGKRRSSAAAVTELALARAADEQHLGAFWALDPAAARTAAAVDGRLADGAAEPLAGVPLAVKDCFDVAGLAKTQGLAVAAPIAAADAEAVRRLRRAGCVPLGKAAMDPLGWTTSGQAAGFPPCRNPLDPDLSPGGSSAGPAVAVAAGIAAAGLGTDVAGSVRIPASYCGVVGFRPAPHTVSSRGVLQLNPRFDVPGIIARSVRDCDVAYAAMSVGAAVDLAARPGLLEVAVLEDLAEEAEPEVAAALALAADALADAGVAVRRVRLGWRPHGFGRLLAADLARGWGARIQREPELYSESLRSSAEFGRSVSTIKVQLALRDLRVARKRLGDRFQAAAAVLSPTTPSCAPPAAEESTARSTQFTRIFSALAWPSLTVPVWTDGAATPAGVHLAAPGISPYGVLRVGRMLERALER